MCYVCMYCCVFCIVSCKDGVVDGYGLARVIYGRFGTDSMPRTTMSICSVGKLWMLVRFATSIIVGDKICTIPTGV